MSNQKRLPSARPQARRCIRVARQLARELRYGEALALMSETIAQVPRPDLYDYRGVLFALQYREGEALEDYDRALALTRDPVLQAQIYYHRSLLYGRRQAYVLALQDVEQALHLDPANTLYLEAVRQIRIEMRQEAGTAKTVPATPIPECEPL